MKRAARDAEWLLLEDAIARILAAVPSLPSERIPLVDAGGRVLATPAISALTLPPWDNSGMDGYAVHAADVEHATRAAPARVRAVGEVHAGGFTDHVLQRGEAL